MKYDIVRFRISGNDNSAIEKNMMRDAYDLLSALAGDAGFESFEMTEEGLDGYAQVTQIDTERLDAILEYFPMDGINILYSVEEAEDKNWNRRWEDEGFEPIVIGDRCVIHDTKHCVENISDTAMDITIDARQAFGTGTHETTRMIVAYLTDCKIAGKDVLDCGCGTGILSIVASKCGAGNVTGYDIDEWSVRNTEHNAGINGAENIDVMHGDISVVRGLNRTFDIVLANINRNILLNDMHVMRSKMRENGMLILSGFYEQDEKMLTEHAEGLGLTLIETRRDNGWSMLVFVIQ